MRKIIGNLKEHAGIWTFGLFIVAAAGGIYQFTATLVSAQITPVKVRIDTEVKRLDAADKNTNDSIAGLEERMNERFDELKKDIKLNREKISLLDEKFDTKITQLNEKLDTKISLLDQKINRLDEKLDKKISRLDEKMDKKFDLILLRLPPLKK